MSKGNWITALFGSIGRDIVEVARNPLALFGGLFGTLLTAALFFVVFVVLIPLAAASEEEDEDEFEIEFTPGTLTKLGEEIEEKELPEKIIVQETRPEEETVADTVTEDEKAAPKEEIEKEPDKKPKKVEKPPVEKKDKKLPKSKLPTQKNTPFKDLPTVKVPKGDPFGDPGGWSDLKRDGDPWATQVMKALNNMPVQSFAAKGATGNMRFQLTLCKDGSIDRVTKKGGNLSPEAIQAVELALNRLKLPRPPSKVASKMRKRCAKIKYTFVWSARGVK